MKIVTHSGSWHPDEVLAIALLAVVLREVPEVTRTRDPKVIQEALQDKNTYVLDVGGQYHPLHKNFDHHQRGFDYRNHKGNKLSTFGLVVKYLSRASSETAATALAEPLARLQRLALAEPLARLQRLALAEPLARLQRLR